MFAMVLINTNCTKDPVVRTLEQKYPDWVNLTWESTDGYMSNDIYPKLNITIIGDTVTILMPLNSIGTIKVYRFTEMTNTSTTVTFSKPIDPDNGYTEFICTDVAINNTVVRFTYSGNEYVLDK